MLESISLKFTEQAMPIKVPAQGVTIFVGPNNSGKSLILRELDEATSTMTRTRRQSQLLEDFEIIWPTPESLDSDLEKLAKKAPPKAAVGEIYLGRFRPDGSLEQTHYDKNSLYSQVAKKNKEFVTSQFLRFFQIRLDGRTRFALTNDQPIGDLIGIPQNVLAHIFQDDDLRKEIRELVFDAFGIYFVIDPLQGGSLRIRLSSEPPSRSEQSLDAVAREFHKNAAYIKDASDGVQAFVGILIAVKSGDYRSVLIDEPEAFLHPPLARKLGHQLASTALKRGGCLFASTHSPDFLIGCLQASPNVRVVRLEYSKGRSKGQIVDSLALNKFFKTPLIRSANVISALFHDGVVITESDNDRAFYSEIYYRLAEEEKGYPSLLFVNAQNKQTIRDIMQPLRAFGVPAAGIVDIDILKDGGTDWTGWLNAAQVPQVLHNGLGQVRGDLRKRFSDLGVNMKADGGVDASKLPVSDRNAAGELFDTLAEYGIFTTRKGEVEHWLPSLNVPGKKTDWTIAMLGRLGRDPTLPDYVRPEPSDVWDFMREIVHWVQNTSRKGTN